MAKGEKAWTIYREGELCVYRMWPTKKAAREAEWLYGGKATQVLITPIEPKGKKGGGGT